MTSIAPCLWYDGQAEQAATFYVSLFPGSRVDDINRAPADFPGGKKGDVLAINFTLDGRRYLGLNGGPQFPFTEAISMAVTVDSQAEIDRLWDALTGNGGQPSRCGWLKDRWGLSWQIVPQQLYDMMGAPDRAAAERATQAMFTMQKLDLAALQRAFNGNL